MVYYFRLEFEVQIDALSKVCPKSRTYALFYDVL